MTDPAPTPLVFERRLPTRVVVDLLLGLGLPLAPSEQTTRTMVLIACHAWLILWLAAVGSALPRRFCRAELWPDVSSSRTRSSPPP